MAPKEKARELIGKYNCKSTALRCIEDILMWCNTDYWQEVKEEINKL